jgi:hypothetical protein
MTRERYPVSYEVSFSETGFSKEDLDAKGRGGCDALILFSIMRGNDRCEPFEGPKSFAIVSCDGRAGQSVPTAELFQAMSHLASFISEQPDISPDARGACYRILDEHRRLIGLEKQPDGTWRRPT